MPQSKVAVERKPGAWGATGDSRAIIRARSGRSWAKSAKQHAKTAGLRSAAQAGW
jgi:hypothetical protein